VRVPRDQAEWKPVSRPDHALIYKMRAQSDAKPVNTFVGSALGVVALSLGLGLAACEDDGGEVAVKLASGFSVPALILGPDRFFSPDGDRFKAKGDGSPTVLREAAGPMRLQYERVNGGVVTACTFNVRKNRVVTVTLRSVGREVKCDIME